MPTIDAAQYLEQLGVRKARFGGFEQEDVRQALRTLCTEFDQQLADAAAEAQALRRENQALQSHCQTLTAQNKKLSGENAALADRQQRSSRRGDQLDGQLASLQERNHSLNDQIARLRLQNDDLTRENAALKDQVSQAEATLRLKGSDLDRQRDELTASRQALLDEARAEAARLVEDAHRQAERIDAEARRQADLMDRTARTQAQAQARRVVEAAAAEANEVQNAHQLRLNDLKAQVDSMEQRRIQLAAYLTRLGNELLETEARCQKNLPAAPLEAPPPLELKAVETPEPELDLSPAALERTARAQSSASASAAPQPLPGPATPVVDAAPHENAPPPNGDAPAPRQSFTLVHDLHAPDAPPGETPARPAPAVEVPGAIFSYPIRQPEQDPLPADAPPRGPRRPVLPVLLDEDDEPIVPPEQRVLGQLDALTGQRPAAAPLPAPVTGRGAAARRRKAIRAVRALRRQTLTRGER